MRFRRNSGVEMSAVSLARDITQDILPRAAHRGHSRQHLFWYGLMFGKLSSRILDLAQLMSDSPLPL